MRRTVKTILGAVLLCSVAHTQAALAQPFASEWIKTTVVNRLSELLGRELSVAGELSVDLSWTPTLRAERVRIANPDWHWIERPYLAEIERLEASIDLRALLGGTLKLPRLSLTRPRVWLQVGPDGRANWQLKQLSPQVLPQAERLARDTLDKTLREVAEQADGAPTAPAELASALPQIEQLRLSIGALSYRDRAAESGFDASIAELSGRLDSEQTRLDGRGELAGRAVTLRLRGDPLAALENAASAPWTLSSFVLRVGDSDLSGRLTVAAEPWLDATLRSEVLDLDQLVGLADALGVLAPAAGADRPTGAVPGFGAELDWRAERLVLPGGADAGGPAPQARLALRLRDGRLRVTPLRLALGQGTMILNAALDTVPMPASGRLTLAVNQLDLAALGLDDAAAGTVDGQLRLRVIGTAPAGPNNALALPGLGRVVIEQPSRLRYAAPAKNTEIRARLGSRAGARGLLLDADGRFRAEPFTLRLAADSPLALRRPDRPYGVELDLNIADTEVEIDGALRQPLRLDGLDLTLAIRGPDPQRLQSVVGLPLPRLPVYAIEGQLNRRGSVLKLNNFDGRVGDSDVAGDIRLNLDTDPLTVYATIDSRRLDLDDLAGLIGGTPEFDSGKNNRPVKPRPALPDSSLLPDRPLDLAAVTRAFNGRVVFSGGRIDIPNFPLRKVAFSAEFGRQALRFTPLRFELAGGSVDAAIEFDTAARPTVGVVSGEVRRLNVKRLLAPFEIADDSLGIVGGRAKFWVYGNSLAEFLGSADGGLFLLMTGGRLDALLTELAGLDVGEALLALSGGADPVPIDCAYFNAHGENGVLGLKTALIDTRDTLFLAAGALDFKRERLGLVIEPRPKDFSLFSLRAPLTIEGPIRQPRLAVGRSAFARGAAAALLGLAAPPAALLPLLETASGTEPVYCRGLINAINVAR